MKFEEKVSSLIGQQTMEILSLRTQLEIALTKLATFEKEKKDKEEQKEEQKEEGNGMQKEEIGRPPTRHSGSSKNSPRGQ